MSSQDEIDTGSTPEGASTDQAPTTSYDPLAALTVAEIQVASRAMGADLVTSITEQTEHYSTALARVLWMHQRRADRTRNPDELWRQITELTFIDLQTQLGELGATEGAGPTQRQP